MSVGLILWTVFGFEAKSRGGDVGRRFLVSLLAVGLLLTSISSSFAAGTVYRPERTQFNDQTQLVQMVEEASVSRLESMLAVQPPAVSVGETRGQWKLCTSVDDPVCDRTDATIDVHAYLISAFCTTPTQDVCIEQLELAAPNGEFKPAIFKGAATEGKTYVESSTLGFPGGGNPLLFDAPHAPSLNGSTEYVVQLGTHWHWDINRKAFYTNMMELTITPSAGPSPDRGTCLYRQGGVCSINDEWVLGTKARVTFRIPSSIGGWFKGRLKDPQVDVRRSASGGNTVTVEAEPVVVPRLVLVRNRADMSAQEQNWMQNNGTRNGFMGTATAYEASQDGIANYIETYRKLVNDTASGENTFWNFTTTFGSLGNRCLSDTSRLVGVVTTNATGYDGGSPVFENGMLTYRVAGLHFASDGKTLNTGTYDLVMRSDAARCLYGFSSAPISATISVISDNGEAKTAVTTVSEKDGWLKMAAYGFTFSNPVLQVKLTQEAPAAPARAVTKPSAAPKPKITCVKGKTVKKVAAAKCPAGFKKRG